MFPLRDSEPSASRPLVTTALIALNVLVFLYEISLDDFSLHALFDSWGVVPARFSVPTIVTSMFLHGGWMHLLGNVWFLWVFGDNIEDVLGHSRYLMFYLACGLAGAIGHLVFSAGSSVPAIGASGAISGVMGAYLVRFPRSRVHTLVFFLIFVTTIEVPAVMMIGYWFVVQIFSGLGQLAMAATGQGGTAWFAHIGGFLAGMTLIRMIPGRPSWRVRQEYRW